jgi:hypothetical protein
MVPPLFLTIKFLTNEALVKLAANRENYPGPKNPALDKPFELDLLCMHLGII